MLLYGGTGITYQEARPDHIRYDFQNGDCYIGELHNSLRHGEGYFASEEEGWEYMGEWAQGDFHGNGWYQDAKGNTYKGNYIKGARQGYGVFIGQATDSITPAVAGDRYFGAWRADAFNDWGIFLHKDGSTEAGIWDHNSLLRTTTVEEAKSLCTLVITS